MRNEFKTCQQGWKEEEDKAFLQNFCMGSIQRSLGWGHSSCKLRHPVMTDKGLAKKSFTKITFSKIREGSRPKLLLPKLPGHNSPKHSHFLSEARFSLKLQKVGRLCFITHKMRESVLAGTWQITKFKTQSRHHQLTTEKSTTIDNNHVGNIFPSKQSTSFHLLTEEMVKKRIY